MLGPLGPTIAEPPNKNKSSSGVEQKASLALKIARGRSSCVVFSAALGRQNERIPIDRQTQGGESARFAPSPRPGHHLKNLYENDSPVIANKRG